MYRGCSTLHGLGIKNSILMNRTLEVQRSWCQKRPMHADFQGALEEEVGHVLQRALWLEIPISYIPSRVWGIRWKETHESHHTSPSGGKKLIWHKSVFWKGVWAVYYTVLCEYVGLCKVAATGMQYYTLFERDPALIVQKALLRKKPILLIEQGSCTKRIVRLTLQMSV